MQKILNISIVALASCFLSLQNAWPDLNNAADLAQLGLGKIIERDNCILKQITLKEVKEQYIVYLKDESLHDKHMDYIKRLEFPNSKWGRIKIEFPAHKALISYLEY